MSFALALTRNSSIPLRVRKKIGRMVPVPANHDFSSDVFGQRYSGSTRTHLDRKVYLYGMHEPATIRLLRDLLARVKAEGRSAVYVDIGLNTGLHALGVAGVADAVYGFEPWGTVRAQAEKNFRDNALSHARIFPFGLSDADAFLPFALPEDDNLGTGAFSPEGKENLEVRCGDDFFAAEGIVPAVIKIDVEGHEKNVLRGLPKILRSARPFVVFEYGSVSRKDFDSAAKREALFGSGYHYYGIRRSREYPVLAPFDPSKKWENVLASPVAF
ncbi:MAG: FkbM family methyltransferase [Alphaproteobacteria bacterium]